MDVTIGMSIHMDESHRVVVMLFWAQAGRFILPIHISTSLRRMLLPHNALGRSFHPPYGFQCPIPVAKEARTLLRALRPASKGFPFKQEPGLPLFKADPQKVLRITLS
ncbi:MAG: hypothetical protein ACUVQY_02505 [Thermoproteota archaeon]